MHRSPTGLLLSWLALLALALPCLGANVTIDDEYGDEFSGALPEFLPEGGWAQGSDCTSCALRPNACSAFRKSWHDTTFHAGGPERSISFTFTGVAVYAFFILPDKVITDVTVVTNLTFVLDGERVGSFVHYPQGASDFIYDEPCYVNKSLSDGPHHLVVSPVAPANQSSVLLFDYLIYTTTQSKSTSVNSSISSVQTAASSIASYGHLISSTSSVSPPLSTLQSPHTTSISVSPSASSSWSTRSASTGVEVMIGVIGVLLSSLCI